MKKNKPLLQAQRSNPGKTWIASSQKALLAMTVFLSVFCTSSAIASHSTLERYGDITQILLPVAGLTATAYLRDLPGFYQWSEAGFVTLASVQLLKHTIHKTRPNGHEQSFPSGHTAAAFWGAGFIQMRYGWVYGIPAYALAGFTGYSRVQTKNHWTTDVLAGMAIGLASNWIFTKPYQSTISISPYFDSERKEQGFTLKADLG